MADAVLALQPGALCSADEVRTLAACLPTDQEAKLLAEYARTQPTLAGLCDAERLCIDLMQARQSSEAPLTSWYTCAWYSKPVRTSVLNRPIPAANRPCLCLQGLSRAEGVKPTSETEIHTVEEGVS